jgi:mRNA interferase MazF
MAVTPDHVRRGDIVVIRLQRDKARPAVVVRSDLLSELSYATVLPITSELRVGISMRIDLLPSSENGLRAASQVMTDWPQTVRVVDMGGVVGRLDAATMRAITRQIAVVLGIGTATGRPRRVASTTRAIVPP